MLKETLMHHNQLQSACFLWAWNTYPETRQLLFHPANEQRPYPNEITKQFSIRLSQAKAIGVVKGVLDLVFYWNGILHVFDIKIGNDRLSAEQGTFIEQVESHGGKSYIISDLNEFKRIFEQIVM